MRREPRSSWLRTTRPGQSPTHERMFTVQTYAVLAALALVIAACAVGAVPPDTTLVGTSSPDSIGPDDSSSTEELSWEELNQLQFTREADVQDFIAACMAEQGFDYVPVLPATPAEESAVGIRIYTPLEPDLERLLTQARTVAFGLFDLNPVESQRALNELLGASNSDPNQQIRDALSPEELEAYGLALYGSEDGAAGVGCFEEAELTYPHPNVPVLVGEYAELLHTKLTERMRADPRHAAAQADYGTCIAEGTSTAASVDDLKNLFLQRTGLDYDTVGNAGLTQVDARVLAGLRAEEVALAEAHMRCTAALYEVQDVVGREIERQLIEEHPEAIEYFGGSR